VRTVAENHPAFGANEACPTCRISGFTAGCHGTLIGSVAERTDDLCPETARPSLFADHPRMELERRTVPDVLVVTARQLGDPVPRRILVKSDDQLFHDRFNLNDGLNDGPTREHSLLGKRSRTAHAEFDPPRQFPLRSNVLRCHSQPSLHRPTTHDHRRGPGAVEQPV
jgi:hypothetical protein